MRHRSRAGFGAFHLPSTHDLAGVRKISYPGYVDAHVLLRKRGTLPVPSGWMAADRLHSDRGHHREYCFLTTVNQLHASQPRRRPPRVPHRASYSSRLQLLSIKPPVPRSRCFITLVSTRFS
jgi:hypothetical protein